MTRIPLALVSCFAFAAVARAESSPVRLVRGGVAALQHAGRLATHAFGRGDVLGAAGHVNPVNVALLTLQHVVAPHARSDDPSSWVQGPGAGGTEQRGMVDADGRIFTRTEARVAAPARDAAPALATKIARPWSSWYGGAYRSLSAGEYERRTGRTADAGAVTYELRPTGVGISVTEHLTGELARDRYRARIRLDGHAVGPAEVRLEPRGDAAALIGEFRGVAPGGPGKLLGPATFAALHLAAEGATRLLPKTGVLPAAPRGFGRLARELGDEARRGSGR